MFSALVLISLVLVPGLVISQLLLNYFTPGLGQIPGPVLARFTDLWRFVDACLGHREQTILRLHQKYGPVVRIGPNCVTVADPDALDLILGLKSNLDKSDHVKPMQNPVEGEVLPMLIAAIDSKVHAQRKRPIAGAFSMSTLLGYENIVDENINMLTRRLREEYVEGGSHQVCSIDKWMHWFSFDLIGQATFSKRFGFLDTAKDINNMMFTLDLQFLYIGTVGFMPWIDYLLLKNPLLLALTKTPNHLVSFTNERIRRRANGEEKGDLEKPDFLSRFLDAQKQHPDVVSDLQVKAYASTNVLAASDTTGAALSTILMFVLRHPNVMSKLQKELDENDLTYPPQYSEAKKLPYLDAVITEALRIHPTVAIELERKVGAGGLVLPTGQELPPGTIVGVNAWPVHRNQDVFGKDTDTFNPDRWLRRADEPEAEFTERIRAMQRKFIEFGYGPRACIGKHIALLELYKLISTLFGLFDVSGFPSIFIPVAATNAGIIA
ncbi:uncharacterized protein A1O9_04781 [Exophiala aquamarina CBS 119918]|uniref:Cytochrome P450 oxidoreductase n=1 Tax=Exophiala aquamarina CBS 119918 TaxID=1182545 RepID=A0A072PKS1_9EURO|nr:uncharacterized protein A1O9_04781 [Exophiala aquamarina CBS 119918]KEF59933.1 hypothetical protein A1O9_04781 [Exophiala aquamarina CBS 119918]